ncbi:hypothetical protein B0H14DRAFT_2601178 [Mycena olivaceomarginata]|nr:hypothetical protein B0H14DRAFT_2601178 [Mycena olivaceomarginata]
MCAQCRPGLRGSGAFRGCALHEFQGKERAMGIAHAGQPVAAHRFVPLHGLVEGVGHGNEVESRWYTSSLGANCAWICTMWLKCTYWCSLALLKYQALIFKAVMGYCTIMEDFELSAMKDAEL